MDSNDVKVAVHDAMASMRSHQITVNYLVVAILALAVTAGVALGFRAIKGYERALAKADERFEQYQKHSEAVMERVLATQEQIVQLAAKQEKIQHTIEIRDRRAAEQIAEVANPSRPVQEIAKDSSEILGAIPTMTAEGLMAYQPFQVQGFVATKLNEQRLEAKLEDTEKLYELEKEKTAGLQKNVTDLTANLTEANGVIDGYRKVVKKSKWRKVGGAIWTGVKYAAVAGGVYALFGK